MTTATIIPSPPSWFSSQQPSCAEAGDQGEAGAFRGDYLKDATFLHKFTGLRFLNIIKDSLNADFTDHLLHELHVLLARLDAFLHELLVYGRR